MPNNLFRNPNSNKVLPVSNGGITGVGSALNAKDKNISKLLENGVTSALSDVETFDSTIVDATKNTLTLSGNRNSDGAGDEKDGYDYGIQQVSIANRAINAIQGILNNTISGNLFGAGLSAVQLANTGTTWKVAYKSEIDRNIYPYKYVYYYNPNKINTPQSGTTKTANNEKDKKNNNSITQVNYLDDIEDPTIFGFTLKIDYLTSPLFQNNNNSANGFITKYTPQHPEMGYALSYLQQFTEYCNKIFISPESVGKDYNTTKYKNSYIYEISGLDKLDNRFVEYNEKEEEHEVLEFTLGEDIRMYVNNMAMLYKNLTWSYNMGKKLIPENLLRFNMYIKISDMRNFTSDIKQKNSDIEDSDSLVDAIRNGYSRIIYELKDCEFIFDGSSIPEKLSMGGFGDVNEEYAQLKLKIKYRKVNRIFYSKMFDPNFSELIIGDKYYTPDTNTYFSDIKNMGFTSSYNNGVVDGLMVKNYSYDNNIPVFQSLSTTLNVLKNKGLFSTNNDSDNAVSNYVKSIGNTAIKAGSTIIDDKMQQAKNSINSAGKNYLNNNMSSNVRDLLKQQVTIGSTDLGTSLTLNTNKDFSNMNEVIDFTASNLTPVTAPNETVYKPTITNINAPKENISGSPNDKIDVPSENVDGSVNNNINAPKENISGSINNTIIAPNENVDNTVNNNIIPPSENVDNAVNNIISAPKENISNIVDNTIKSPSENVDNTVNNKINSPSENISNKISNTIIAPNENISGAINNKIIEPLENVEGTINNKIQNPTENISNIVNDTIQSPNENIEGSVNNNLSVPKENISGSINNTIVPPSENISGSISNKIIAPNENISSSISNKIIAPNENISDLNEKSAFKKYIIQKNEDALKNDNPLEGDCD